MRRPEQKSGIRLLPKLSRLIAVGLLGFVVPFSYNGEASPTHAQSESQVTPELAGGEPASEFIASSSVWIEHFTDGSVSKLSGTLVFPRIVVTALHGVDDNQDFELNPSTTHVNFATAPELGSIKPLRVIKSTKDVVYLILPELPKNANITTMPLLPEDEVFATAETDLKVVANGRFELGSFAEWPQMGDVQVTEGSCLPITGRLVVERKPNTTTQVNPADSGGALVMIQKENGIDKKFMVAMTSGYCYLPPDTGGKVITDPVPARFTQINTGEHRNQLEALNDSLVEKMLSLPPNITTRFYVNGELADMDGVTSAHLSSKDAHRLELVITDNDFENLATNTISSLTFNQEQLLSCATITAEGMTSGMELRPGRNDVGIIQISSNCEESENRPYDVQVAAVTTSGVITASFHGPDGEEQISTPFRNINNLYFYNDLTLIRDNLSETPNMIYDDEMMTITASIDNDVINLNVKSLNRPGSIGIRLASGGTSFMASGILPIYFRWNATEKATIGQVTEKNIAIPVSDFVFAPKPVPVPEPEEFELLLPSIQALAQ